MNIMLDSDTAIFYETEVCPQLNGRSPIVATGGILGGGSSINFMMYDNTERIKDLVAQVLSEVGIPELRETISTPGRQKGGLLMNSFLTCKRLTTNNESINISLILHSLRLTMAMETRRSMDMVDLCRFLTVDSSVHPLEMICSRLHPSWAFPSLRICKTWIRTTGLVLGTNQSHQMERGKILLTLTSIHC